MTLPAETAEVPAFTLGATAVTDDTVTDGCALDEAVPQVPSEDAPRRRRISGGAVELARGRGLFGRFVYLVATQIVTVVLGAGYWALSARELPAHHVGVASAAISAATLLTTIGMFGLTSSLLVILGPAAPERRRAIVTTGSFIAAGAAVLLSLGALAMSPLLGASLRDLASDDVASGLFVLGAVLTAVTNVVDAAALGLHQSGTRLARNTIASLGKVVAIGVIILLGARTVTGLLWGWDASTLASLAVWPLLRFPKHARIRWSERMSAIRSYWRLSMLHHVVNLSLGSISYLLPLVVAILEAPKQVAYFTIAQLISSSALLVPFLLTMSLFIETSGDTSLLRRSILRTLPVSLGASIVVLGIFEPGAHLVLSVFGPQYATQGTPLLRVLLIGGVPYVVKDHLMAARRAQNRLDNAARMGLVTTLFEVASAAGGGAVDGTLGICVGWVIACLIEGLVLLAPLARVLLAHPSAAPAGAQAVPAQSGS